MVALFYSDSAKKNSGTNEVGHNALLGGMTGWLLGGDGEVEATRSNTRLAEREGPEYSLADKRIPTYDELVHKPDIKVVDIRDNRGMFRERQKALLNRDVNPVVNADTGEKIFVTKKAFTHSFSNSETERTAAAEKIDDIIENAVLTYKEPSDKTGDHSTGVYTFFGAVLTNEGIKPVKLKVKEYFLTGQDIPRGVKELLETNDDTYATAYDSRVLVLEEIEKKMLPVTAATMPVKTGVNYPSASSTISVADLIGLVNSEYQRYLPARTVKSSRSKPSTESEQNATDRRLYTEEILKREKETSSGIYANFVKKAEAEKARKIADKLGVKLELVSLGANIRGKYENGTITINTDRGDPVMEVFVHELTHHLERSGDYGRLRSAALRYISENLGADIAVMKADVISEYAEGGIELDDAGAEYELVAQFCSEMLFADEESIIRLVRTDRNLAQRIYDWICDTISKIGKNADARTLIDARRIYENALRTVGDTKGESAKYSFGEKKIPTYNELISKPDVHVVDIRADDNRDFNEFRASKEAELIARTPVVNKDTGEKVFISQKTFTHSFFGKGAYKINAAKKIRELIENAVLTHSESSRNDRSAEIGVYTLFGAVRTENGIQPVKLKVKEYVVDGRSIPQVVKNYFEEYGGDRIYAKAYDSRVLVVEGIENEGSDSTVLAASQEADRYLPEPSRISVAELYELVNTQYPQYLPMRTVKASYGSSLEERARKAGAKAVKKSTQQNITDRMLYAEEILKQTEKNGSIYAKALIEAEIENVRKNSAKPDAKETVPTGNIYADYIKTHEDELQQYIQETEEELSEESVSADARDKLGEIVARGTTKIKQGFSAFSKDDILFERAKRVKPDGNKFDVAMHGTSKSVCFGGYDENMSPRLLAAVIKHSEGYHGQEIRLLSCSTGKSVNGEYCFAEELANALGVTVYAPNNLINFFDDGTFEIGRNNEGSFIAYKPNERRRLK